MYSVFSLSNSGHVHQESEEFLFGMSLPGRAFCLSGPILKYDLFSTSDLQVVVLNRVSMGITTWGVLKADAFLFPYDCPHILSDIAD